MNRAVIGVGSNIDPEIHTARALELLTKKYHEVRSSRWVWTRPLGNVKQPDFLNGAVYLETPESKEKLLSDLKEMEQVLGRTAEQRGFRPRTIDLDLILWNEEIVHPDFYSRIFLQTAIRELLPSLIISRPP
jgi:2-amino-4-hydroxy-6-hydroxymethyldihydropteridine diphosphokinase